MVLNGARLQSCQSFFVSPDPRQLCSKACHHSNRPSLSSCNSVLIQYKFTHFQINNWGLQFKLLLFSSLWPPTSEKLSFSMRAHHTYWYEQFNVVSKCCSCFQPDHFILIHILKDGVCGKGGVEEESLDVKPMTEQSSAFSFTTQRYLSSPTKKETCGAWTAEVPVSEV